MIGKELAKADIPVVSGLAYGIDSFAHEGTVSLGGKAIAVLGTGIDIIHPVRNAWQGSYYLKADGKMAQSEWIYDSSYQAWYYLKSDGSYARNAWQGNYYLKSDGKMAKNERVDGGRYYVDASGLWKP